jgi:SPP1 family predicted phage head-tail adaptor
MRTGRLRHRVEIQRLTTTQDSYGEPVETWTKTATVWAEMLPSLRATREAFAAQSEQRSARLSMECHMRYRAVLTPKETRLIWEDKVYEVEAVMDPDGRRRESLLLCYVRE